MRGAPSVRWLLRGVSCIVALGSVVHSREWRIILAGERFLVTGALGCIGAWTVRNLVREGVPTVVFDLASNPQRLRLIMTPDELAQVTFVTGDITDLAALEQALDEHAISNIIHLAALQVPFCRADPPLGARVNVVGTVNVFEAVARRKERIDQVVYASSVAVYDAADAAEPGAAVQHGATGHPTNLYGVYKQANEGTARIYWQDHRVASIGLRPDTVYGPGRDQGMTSSPTKAMFAAAVGQPYLIPSAGAASSSMPTTWRARLSPARERPSRASRSST